MQLRLRPSQWRGSNLAADTIREVIFGAEDGTVQNTALIAGMVGAGLSGTIVVIAGLVNAIAGVLSMSAGAYLSSKAERDTRRAGQRSEVIRDSSPTRDAMVMAVAYAVGAVVPLLPFLAGSIGPHAALVVAIIAAAGVLWVLGAIKAVASGGSIVRSGAEMLLLAAGAGFAGYGLGFLVGAALGIER
jgi:VIT1/CCC1 family predicted Fe2+/Mn2+ transporter